MNTGLTIAWQPIYRLW